MMTTSASVVRHGCATLCCVSTVCALVRANVIRGCREVESRTADVGRVADIVPASVSLSVDSSST